MCQKSFYRLLFLFITVFSINSFAQSSNDDTSMVLLRFNEPMSRDGIFNVENYQILSSDNEEVRVYKVGIVEGDTAVVLFTEKHIKGKDYKVFVSNLKDKAGNLINNEKNFAVYP